MTNRTNAIYSIELMPARGGWVWGIDREAAAGRGAGIPVRILDSDEVFASAAEAAAAAERRINEIRARESAAA